MSFWRYVPPSLCQILACMGGCLGCFPNPPVIISMEEEPKDKRNQGQAVNRSEDFWSSSTLEMDHSAAQSQGSISSVGISNRPSDPQSRVDNQIHPPEFVNHGHLLWNQIRQQWVGNRRHEHQRQVGEPSWNTYENLVNLLGTNLPYPQPIPLEEMVDFLVDVWEKEGLYD